MNTFGTTFFIVELLSICQRFHLFLGLITDIIKLHTHLKSKILTPLAAQQMWPGRSGGSVRNSNASATMSSSASSGANGSSSTGSGNGAATGSQPSYSS